MQCSFLRPDIPPPSSLPHRGCVSVLLFLSSSASEGRAPAFYESPALPAAQSDMPCSCRDTASLPPRYTAPSVYCQTPEPRSYHRTGSIGPPSASEALPLPALFLFHIRFHSFFLSFPFLFDLFEKL